MTSPKKAATAETPTMAEDTGEDYGTTSESSKNAEDNCGAVSASLENGEDNYGTTYAASENADADYWTNGTTPASSEIPLHFSSSEEDFAADKKKDPPFVYEGYSTAPNPELKKVSQDAALKKVSKDADLKDIAPGTDSKNISQDAALKKVSEDGNLKDVAQETDSKNVSQDADLKKASQDSGVTSYSDYSSYSQQSGFNSYSQNSDLYSQTTRVSTRISPSPFSLYNIDNVEEYDPVYNWKFTRPSKAAVAGVGSSKYKWVNKNLTRPQKQPRLLDPSQALSLLTATEQQRPSSSYTTPTSLRRTSVVQQRPSSSSPSNPAMFRPSTGSSLNVGPRQSASTGGEKRPCSSDEENAPVDLDKEGK